MKVDWTLPAWVAAEHGHLLSLDFPEVGPVVEADCRCGWTTRVPVRISDPSNFAVDEWADHVLSAIAENGRSRFNA